MAGLHFEASEIFSQIWKQKLVLDFFKSPNCLICRPTIPNWWASLPSFNELAAHSFTSFHISVPGIALNFVEYYNFQVQRALAYKHIYISILHLVIRCSFIQNSYIYNAIFLHDEIYFQTKLNCEILDDAKAFEVRWAIAGKSIVTQLVARYITIS